MTRSITWEGDTQEASARPSCERPQESNPDDIVAHQRYDDTSMYTRANGRSFIWKDAWEAISGWEVKFRHGPKTLPAGKKKINLFVSTVAGFFCLMSWHAGGVGQRFGMEPTAAWTMYLLLFFLFVLLCWACMNAASLARTERPFWDGTTCPRCGAARAPGFSNSESWKCTTCELDVVAGMEPMDLYMFDMTNNRRRTVINGRRFDDVR